jgi:ABC-type amino acid transport substrate-binding protein
MKKILAMFLLSFTLLTFGETLEVLSFYYPPFMGESSMSKEGIMPELIGAAFAETGVDIKLTILPTKRAISLISNNQSLAYVGILRTFPPEVQKNLEVYSFIKLRFLVFYKNSRFPNGLNFTQLSDLKPYSIGVIPGLTSAVGQANGLKVEPANTLDLVFKKVQGGRNDMGVAVDLAIKTMLDELFKGQASSYTIHDSTPFVTAESTLLLNTKHPDYAKFAPKLKQGMKAIVNNGKWMEIMEKFYGKGNVPNDSYMRVQEVVKDF